MNNEALKQYSLLFVEDEKAIRENYIHYLRKYFNNIYEAQDGQEAYKRYLEKKPEVMIVDINLPSMTGIELIKKIRESDHSTKIVMLTAHSDVTTLLQATELKLTKYLVKPVSRSELQDALDQVFEELSKFSVLSKRVLRLNEAYSWNYETNELLCEHVTITLTNKEVELLKLLFSKVDKTFTYDEIMQHVWEYTYEDKSDALKTIIKNIRRKLPKDTIKNIFGIGYKINIL